MNDLKQLKQELKETKNKCAEIEKKIDGMNIRIYWDGHRVSFYGWTNNAQIPSALANRLSNLFLGEANEQLFEQRFGETEVIFFGEGYGGKIQSGGAYKKEQDFILFDVMLNGEYQQREDIEEYEKRKEEF